MLAPPRCGGGVSVLVWVCGEEGTMAQQGPWLIVGLGNPGPRYEMTRHNIGYLVADELADRIGGNFSRHKAQAQVVSGVLGPIGPDGVKVIVAKPMSFMNTSGGPVSGLCKFYDISPDRLIVIHDELDIDFDRIRLKCGGGEGGHNGLRSISTSLGTKDYLRVRAGIGRPPGRQSVSDYVLSAFGAVECKSLALFVGEVADAVESLVREGLLATQQRFHGS